MDEPIDLGKGQCGMGSMQQAAFSRQLQRPTAIASFDSAA